MEPAGLKTTEPRNSADHRSGLSLSVARGNSYHVWWAPDSFGLIRKKQETLELIRKENRSEDPAKPRNLNRQLSMDSGTLLRETWPTDSPSPGDSVPQAVRTHAHRNLFYPNSHSEDCLEEHPSLACWHETPLAIPAGRHCCRPDGSGDSILPPGFSFDCESPELQQGRAPHPFEPLFPVPRTRCPAAESPTSARHLRWGCSPS
jgi:hypothetical protein